MEDAQYFSIFVKEREKEIEIGGERERERERESKCISCHAEADMY